MVVLTDIPFVLPLAEWIWGADTSQDVSPEICLSQIPFISTGCFSTLVAKALGMAIIFGSCLNKAPIVINMMKSQSAVGISRTSLYGEALVYANCVLYGFLAGHPFTAYGENASLLIQNYVLVAMAWQFSTSPIKSQEKVLAIAGLTFYIISVLNFLPESSLYLLMSSTWPVMLYARGSQVLETFRVKQTGNLSIITTSMSLVGALIRIGTTLKETGDTVVLSGYLLSCSLSFAMFVQYWMYLEKTTQVAKEMKEVKAKKEI
jgi:mannose-P-dolichol utilization defect protein 1